MARLSTRQNLSETTIDAIWDIANPSIGFYNPDLEEWFFSLSNGWEAAFVYVGDRLIIKYTNLRAFPDMMRLAFGRCNAKSVPGGEDALPALLAAINNLESFESRNDRLPNDYGCTEPEENDDEEQKGSDPVESYVEERNKRFPMWDWI